MASLPNNIFGAKEFTDDETEQLKKAVASGTRAGMGLRSTFTGRKEKKMKARDLKKGNKLKVKRKRRSF